MKTLYDTLGINNNAHPDEIRKAFRRKAKKLHPDVLGGDADKFDRAKKAYDVLSDPVKRLAYDRTGKVDDKPRNPEHLRMAQDVVVLFKSTLDKLPLDALDTFDLVGAMAADVSASLRGLEDALRNIAASRRKLKKAAKRLKHKGSGIDFLHEAIEADLRQLDAQEAQITEGLAYAEKLKEYITSEWEVEKGSQPMYIPLDIAVFNKVWRMPT